MSLRVHVCLIPDVSICIFCDCVPVCVACLCGDAPSGLRAGGRDSHPSGTSQLCLHGVFCLPASQDSQPAQPSPAEQDTLCPLFQVRTCDTDTAMALPTLHPPCLGGVRVDMASISLVSVLLSKERIIIPGQAASATNLREIIVERVERKKS